MNSKSESTTPSDKTAAFTQQLQAFFDAPPPRTQYGGFTEGVKSAWWGARYLWTHRSLASYAILPTIVNIIITAFVFGLLVVLVGAAAVWMHSYFTAGQTGGWWWLYLCLEILATLVLLFVCGGIAIIVWKFMTGILCGYFYGKLAERVERQLGIEDDEIKSITFFYELVGTVIDIALLIVITGVGFACNLLPVVGSAVGLIGGVYFSAMVLGMSQLAYPLGMRGYNRMEQLNYARKNMSRTAGLGTVVYLFEFLPIIGALFVTAAIVGGVLLHRRIEACEAREKADEPPKEDPSTLEEETSE